MKKFAVILFATLAIGCTMTQPTQEARELPTPELTPIDGVGVLYDGIIDGINDSIVVVDTASQPPMVIAADSLVMDEVVITSDIQLDEIVIQASIELTLDEVVIKG
jgi:hypothetical protein